MQTLDEPRSPPLQYTLVNNPSPITTSLCLDREYSQGNYHHPATLLLLAIPER
jgi:hypothetical protein